MPEPPTTFEFPAAHRRWRGVRLLALVPLFALLLLPELWQNLGAWAPRENRFTAFGDAVFVVVPMLGYLVILGALARSAWRHRRARGLASLRALALVVAARWTALPVAFVCLGVFLFTVHNSFGQPILTLFDAALFSPYETVTFLVGAFANDLLVSVVLAVAFVLAIAVAGGRAPGEGRAPSSMDSALRT